MSEVNSRTPETHVYIGYGTGRSLLWSGSMNATPRNGERVEIRHSEYLVDRVKYILPVGQKGKTVIEVTVR